MLLQNVSWYSKAQPNTCWEIFFKKTSNTSILFIYVWLFPLVALSSHLFPTKYEIFKKNLFHGKPLLGLIGWLIHWSRCSVRSVCFFFFIIINKCELISLSPYLNLWPECVCWKFQLITICTKCFSPAKSLVNELYWLFMSQK